MGIVRRKLMLVTIGTSGVNWFVFLMGNKAAWAIDHPSIAFPLSLGG